MLVGLHGEVPEDHGVIVPGYSFWFYPRVFAVLNVALAHIVLYTIEATLWCLSLYTVLAS